MGCAHSLSMVLLFGILKKKLVKVWHRVTLFVTSNNSSVYVWHSYKVNMGTTNKSRRDSRLELLYKDLKHTANITTGDLIPPISAVKSNTLWHPGSQVLEKIFTITGSFHRLLEIGTHFQIPLSPRRLCSQVYLSCESYEWVPVVTCPGEWLSFAWVTIQQFWFWLYILVCLSNA